MSTPYPPHPLAPRVPGAATIARAGAVVTLGQALVLLGFLLSIIFTFGLALFVFFVPLFCYLIIPWSAGDRLLPGPARGRGWIAMALSVPISLTGFVGGVGLALAVVGTEHDTGWPYLVDLVIISGFAAGVGAVCWPAIGAVMRRFDMA